MGSVSFVCRELFCNRNRLIRLARYERASLNKGTALGALWNLLNPGLQIFIYWFVFSVGLRVKPMDDGTPYVVWMMTGLLP